MVSCDLLTRACMSRTSRWRANTSISRDFPRFLTRCSHGSVLLATIRFTPMVLRDDRPVNLERREQLLEIAKAVFAERDYQATTMDDIAKAAGFTKPILYQYFESKGTLYQEIVSHTGAVLVENLMRAVTSVTTPRSKIESAFRVYFEMVVNDRSE